MLELVPIYIYIYIYITKITITAKKHRGVIVLNDYVPDSSRKTIFFFYLHGYPG